MHFPEDLLYTKDHEWIRIEGEKATIGITDYAQSEMGDVVYVEIETLGEQMEQHDIFGSVEAVKTVSDLFMPISGEIKAVNEALEDDPELVNKDPYGKGWMIVVQLDSPNPDTSDLLNSSDYSKMVAEA